MSNFVWNMTESQWNNLVADHKLAKSGETNPKYSKDADVYGNCCIGALRADIQHTLDPEDCYAFANIFALGVDDGYGETPSGTPYALLDGGPEVPMRAKSFETFKAAFEEHFTEYIEKNPHRVHLSTVPVEPGAWD